MFLELPEASEVLVRVWEPSHSLPGPQKSSNLGWGRKKGENTKKLKNGQQGGEGNGTAFLLGDTQGNCPLCPPGTPLVHSTILFVSLFLYQLCFCIVRVGVSNTESKSAILECTWASQRRSVANRP